MVVSPATLGDRAKIRQVRASLAKQGRIEAIIALPAGGVPGSELAPFLWVIAGKPDKRKANRTLAISAPTLEGDQPLQHDGLHQVAEVTRRWLNDAVPPSSQSGSQSSYPAMTLRRAITPPKSTSTPRPLNIEPDLLVPATS